MIPLKLLFGAVKSGAKTFAHNVNKGYKVGKVVSVMNNSRGIKKIGTIGKGVYTEAVKPITNTIKKDVVGIKNMPTDIKRAYKHGIKTAQTLNKGIIRKTATVTKSVYSDGVKPHIAGVFGGVGTFVPIPLAQPVLYCAGKTLQLLF